MRHDLFYNRPPCWEQGCSRAVFTGQGASHVPRRELVEWSPSFYQERSAMEQVHFTPRACLSPCSLPNFLRETLRLWPVDNRPCPLLCPHRDGEENRGCMGRWIRCSIAELHLLPRCTPTFCPGLFSLSNTKLGICWDSARELDFALPHSFLSLLAEASLQPTRFPCYRNVWTQPACWWFLSIPSKAMTYLLYFAFLWCHFVLFCIF